MLVRSNVTVHVTQSVEVVVTQTSKYRAELDPPLRCPVHMVTVAAQLPLPDVTWQVAGGVKDQVTGRSQPSSVATALVTFWA